MNLIEEKNIFPRFPAIVFDELTEKYSIEITAKDAIVADNQRQQILDDYEKARKLEKISKVSADMILQNQKLRELIEKIDIDLVIQQISEWAFLQGQNLTTEKRNQLGDIKDNLLKVKQLFLKKIISVD